MASVNDVIPLILLNLGFPSGVGRSLAPPIEAGWGLAASHPHSLFWLHGESDGTTLASSGLI